MFMKKGLIYLLVVLILANFHCARFSVTTVNFGKALASCRAWGMDFSEDTAELEKGKILLTENSFLFESRGKIKDIPYSHISTIEIDGTDLSAIPRVPVPSLHEGDKKKSNTIAISAFVLFMLVVALVFIFVVLVPHAGIDMNIYFDSDGDRKAAMFQLAPGELAKIYPLLMEKTGQYDD
jgi:hypothetical protein